MCIGFIFWQKEYLMDYHWSKEKLKEKGHFIHKFSTTGEKMHIHEGYSLHWNWRKGKHLITWFAAPVCFKGCVDSLLSKGKENWVNYSTVLGNGRKEKHTKLLRTLSKYNSSSIITVTYNELVSVMYWKGGVEFLFILYILGTEFFYFLVTISRVHNSQNF